MNREQILEEFTQSGALLNGHFVLSSGLHSSTYVQCARALMDTKRANRLGAALADNIHRFLSEQRLTLDLIVAPAMGGVVIGYEMGRQLELPTIFCERVNGSFELRRGFEISKGQRVLIVEDVVTTGKSSMETANCIRQWGGEPVMVASLIDRRTASDIQLTLPLVALLTLDIPSYREEELPPELQAVPAVKPGSRWLKAS